MSEVYAWLAGQADRVIETSCAWVFLQGERALKLKKPVDYGFLDFSTLEKRHWALSRELAFNRITAPDGTKKTVGDVDFDPVRQKAAHITPVPGGVGPMTVAMLLKNPLRSAELLASKSISG